MGIKDFLPKQASFCEHTWEVIVYMVIISKKRSGPDIWPEISNKATNTEDIILTIWYKKAMKQTEINPQQYYSSSSSAKKACYASYTSSYLKNSYAHLVIDTCFYH